MQKYKIFITREDDGQWSVAGYWEVKGGAKIEWSRDGATLHFKTRAEVAAYLAQAQGIPE